MFKRIVPLIFIFLFFTGCSNIDKYVGVNKNEDGVKIVNEPQGITVNKIKFDEININNAPEKLKKDLKKLQSKRGYIYENVKGEYYIAVLSGKKPTAGYTIRILSIEDNEGKTNIMVEEKGPAEGNVVSQVITCPYVIVKAEGITENFNIKNTEEKDFEKISN